MINKTLLDIADAMPEQFPFYHLGHVETQPLENTDEITSLLHDTKAIAFSLYGERRALIVVLFDKGLDHSMYSELGNIIVSKLADNLGQRAGIDVMISPPNELSTKTLEAMIQAAAVIQTRSYLHTQNNNNVRVNTLILSGAAEKTAHA